MRVNRPSVMISGRFKGLLPLFLDAEFDGEGYFDVSAPFRDPEMSDNNYFRDSVNIP